MDEKFKKDFIEILNHAVTLHDDLLEQNDPEFSKIITQFKEASLMHMHKQYGEFPDALVSPKTMEEAHENGAKEALILIIDKLI